MHHLEPYYNWRHIYSAETDSQSPFFGKEYNEFAYTEQIYNHYIHPQWDFFGSNTLYMKLIMADYDLGYAIIEFIGEWNDAIGNDIMYLKREIIDTLIDQGIYKFVLIGENVLNFHYSDNAYYEEWYEDVIEEGGWVIGINFREHVMEEMHKGLIHHFMYIGNRFTDVNWRTYKPHHLAELVEERLFKVLPG